MEVRCGSCNKLFRVSDEKITGTGIKFKCTRCGEYIKITHEEFEQYRQSKEVPPAFHMPGPKPEAAQTGPEGAGARRGPAIDVSGFDFPKPQSPAPHQEPRSGPEVLSEPAVMSPLSTPDAGPGEERKTSRPARSLPVPSAVEGEEGLGAVTAVHPLAAGAAAGIAGGLGCAVPVLALMFLGLGIVARFVPFLSQMPVYIIAAAFAAGLMSIGIIISIFVSLIQAWAGKKLFFMLNILLGALFGGVLGAVHGIVLSLVSRTGMNPLQIGSSAVGWAITAFLLSVSIVVMRRIMLSSKQESFGTRLSGAQVLAVVLSVSIIGLSVYGEVLVTSRIRSAAEAAVSKLKDMTSPEGLQITSPAGYRDAGGDLIITGDVQNSMDKEKVTWYIVADVYDAQGGVLVQAGMMNGKQLYTQRDYDILSKRGVNVAEFKVKNLQDAGTPIPPRGTAHFEFRIMEPPAAMSSFLVTARQVDPVKMMRDMADALKQKRQEQAPGR